ncbi:chitobiase/beta-hexosaminidase C-terminal domain-containing protein [uncultured Prevotella sp.]|uniref:chitobiase/beta-hexosaminidase C-terminal domain-containing protein n=1 Tax=uncultured Prevotella sp. TaxID=159272 RepID=UPI00265D2C71|nr:chitobiase/beta-hexosaminidase C-terminal domain-containing protein [uncultured Prevotella sp.]
MKKLLHTQRRGLALWLLTLMCLASVNVWGQETVYTFKEYDKNSHIVNGVNGEIWNTTGTISTSDVNDFPSDPNSTGANKRGVAFQSNGTLTSSFSVENITKVILDVSSNGSKTTTIQSVKIGETVFTPENVSINKENHQKLTFQSSTPASGQICISVTRTSKTIWIGAISLSSSTPECSAPTFSPASGTSFANTLTVTASTATEGGKIVYTTDPEATLDANSTEFPSEGLTIDATTTIRAITVDPNGALENSSEVSATYTKINALNGLAELRAKIREDNVTSQKDAKEYIVSLNNAVVTKVNGNNAFIEENETGIQYFKYNNDLKEGQVINGTATVKGFMYNNWAELTSIEGDITITDGGAVAPTEVALEELTNNYDKYESRLVKVTAAEVTSAFSNRNGEISQNGTTLAVRAADESISMTLGETIDIIGVLGIYFDTKQLNVFSQDDITKDENAKTFSWTATSAEIDINNGDITTLPTLTNTYEGAVNYDSSNKGVATIGETDGQITIVGAGTTTITATLASDPEVKSSYELTVNKTTATLEFEQSIYTVNFEDITTLKAVSNNPDAQITYSTTNGDWYIDETSGEFLAGTTAGSVTVTATMAESDKYTGATATCTVKIVDPNQQVYSDVITAADLKGEANSYKDFSGVTKTSGAVYAGNSANKNGSIQLRSDKSNSGIVATTSGGRISQIIITWDNSTANARQIDVYGNTNPYTSAAELYETSGNTNQGELIGSLAKGETTLTIEGNYPYVGIRSNDGALYIKDITFVWKKVSEPTTGSFSITDAGFATYYTDKAFVMPENVQGGIVTKANNETSQLTVSYNYQPGTVVPAKTPIVLKGEKGDYTVNYTTSEETAPAGNMLYGADNVDADGMTFVKGTNVKYYKLALGNDGKCGFYWGAADGAAFEYTANRAFLAIDITDASQAPEGFSLDGDGGTTGIDGIMNGNDDSQKIYTVTGVYAGKSLDKLPKGIYIVGGKKVAVK